MADGLILIGSELATMVDLSIRLRSLTRNVTIQESPRPLAAALLEPLANPLAVVIYLTGSENVADIRAVMTSNQGTRFLFISKEAPPRASMVHAVHSCGGEVLPRCEASVVVAATLVAMTAASTASA